MIDIMIIDSSSQEEKVMKDNLSHLKTAIVEDNELIETSDSDVQDPEANIREDLTRALKPRHVNMLSIAGVIGTGLYLSTSSALNKAGPASLFMNYVIMGIVIYLDMLCLGEMSTYMPISGSFCSYAKKFGSESFAWALMWNYWFEDALSVASSLTALQLILDYWKTSQHHFPYWAAALLFWVFVLALNVIHVGVYGEAEYWLALLKVIAIVIFFILSIVVNAGHNPDHKYIGFQYWTHGEAPFVHGFRGFASMFVSASYAYGGIEALTLTGGEVQNPLRNTPKVIKTVFWRVLIFYVFSTFFIAMNVPYNYPGLATNSVMTSPFTIVFQMAGSKNAGSFMNAVIMTSVISGCNHALFAGSRIMYNMGLDGYLPRKIVSRTNRYKAPYVSIILTWAVGGICFGASFIGAGILWDWLQNIGGVSYQIAWLCIAITSIRFRRGLEVQGKTHELKFKNWTYPYGPYFLVVFVTFIILIQGWSAFAPWSTSKFFSLYLELFVFPACYFIWWIFKRDWFVKYEDMDFETDRYIPTPEIIELNEELDNLKGWRKWRQHINDYFV